MIDQLKNILGDGYLSILIYAIIFLIMLIGIAKCVLPVFVTSCVLNRAVARLEKSIKRKYEKGVWRDSRFLGHRLREDWERFLLNANQLEECGMPCDTNKYINMETAISIPGHTQLAELIPTFLTSMGLLGTFMGIVQGFTGIDFSGTNETISSITLLLSGMRFAFGTSIAGLVGSLIFSLSVRLSTGLAVQALARFERTFYKIVMPRPVDAEVQALCQHQGEDIRLQRSMEMLADRMAITLDNAIKKTISPLVNRMDQLINHVAYEQTEGMRSVVKQFIRDLNITLSTEITDLSATMKKIAKSNSSAQNVIDKTLTIANDLCNEAQKIQKSTSTISEVMHQEADSLELLEKTGMPPALMMNQALQEVTASLYTLQKTINTFTADFNMQPEETPAGNLQEHEIA